MEEKSLNSDYLEMEIKEKIDRFNTRNIIIYGSGKDSKVIKELLLKNKYRVQFFCDTDEKRSGEIIEGISIISLSELIEKYRNCIVIIASRRYQVEMYLNLVKINFEDERIIIPIYDTRIKSLKTCSCCGRKVRYFPLPMYYEEMTNYFGGKKDFKAETLNADEYFCPICYSSDRDRLIVSFMKKIGLPQKSKEKQILQIAPAKAIEIWIYRKCKELIYHSTDLYMNNVTFISDIQNMKDIKDESYDYFICSHVLEHVKDDKKAMAELYRILKQDGIGLFLVPIDLNAKKIDEEWGLSEAENWRRFGQGDHCRRYVKKEMLDRLEKTGFIVTQLGKEYFGEEIFKEAGLGETSVLYVLTKQIRKF